MSIHEELTEFAIHEELTEYANDFAKEDSVILSLPKSPLPERGRKHLAGIAGLDQPLKRTPTSVFVRLMKQHEALVKKYGHPPYRDAFCSVAMNTEETLTRAKFDAWAVYKDWYPVFRITA